MYRDPPAVCCVCGEAIDAHEADVTEAGLRCRRCTDAAELAAVKPALDEARAAQQAWAKIHAKHPPQPLRAGHCSHHAEYDTRCFWCVLSSWLPAVD